MGWAWLCCLGGPLPASQVSEARGETAKRKRGWTWLCPPTNQQTHTEHLVLNFSEDVSAEPGLRQSGVGGEGDGGGLCHW